MKEFLLGARKQDLPAMLNLNSFVLMRRCQHRPGGTDIRALLQADELVEVHCLIAFGATGR